MIFRATLFVTVFFGVVNAYAATPAAPDGIGPLKLGMTPSQVESLKQGNVMVSDFRIADKQDNPGSVKYTSMLKSPISIYPNETDLHFSGGKLTDILLRFPDAPSDSSASFTEDQQDAIKMLTAKYGAPKIEKQWEDKQCVYGNGNSFTKKNGSERFRWSFALPGGMETVVTVSTSILDMCPVSLRYSLGGDFSPRVESRYFYMRLAKKSPTEANLF